MQNRKSEQPKMQNRKPKMQKVPAREAQQKHGTGISNNLDRFTTEK